MNEHPVTAAAVAGASGALVGIHVVGADLAWHIASIVVGAVVGPLVTWTLTQLRNAAIERWSAWRAPQK